MSQNGHVPPLTQSELLKAVVYRLVEKYARSFCFTVELFGRIAFTVALHPVTGTSATIQYKRPKEQCQPQDREPSPAQSTATGIPA